MARTRRTVLTFAAIILMATISSCGDKDSTLNRADSGRSADSDSIRALLAANEAATNRRDATGVAATFVSNAELWVANGPRISGLDEIRQNEEAFYRTPGLQNWSVAVKSIRFLTSDVALVDEVSTTTLESRKTRSRASIVVVRDEGGWRIGAVHVMEAGD